MRHNPTGVNELDDLVDGDLKGMIRSRRSFKASLSATRHENWTTKDQADNKAFSRPILQYAAGEYLQCTYDANTVNQTEILNGPSLD